MSDVSLKTEEGFPKSLTMMSTLSRMVEMYIPVLQQTLQKRNIFRIIWQEGAGGGTDLFRKNHQQRTCFEGGEVLP